MSNTKLDHVSDSLQQLGQYENGLSHFRFLFVDVVFETAVVPIKVTNKKLFETELNTTKHPDM